MAMSDSGTNGTTEEPVDELPELLRAAPVFRGLHADCLRDLATATSRLSLPGGATLLAAGEPADGIYLLLHGVVAAFGGRDAARPTRSFVAGDAIGVAEALSGHRGGESLLALRDAELAHLPAVEFESLLRRYPEALRAIAREVVTELAAPESPRLPARTGVRTMALVPLGGVGAAPSLPDWIVAGLAPLGRTRLVTVAEGAGQTSDWFHRLEHDNDHVVYLCDADASPWTRLCVRQADVLLLVAPAALDPTQLGAITELRAAARAGSEVELVLVHDAALAPGRVRRWRQRCRVSRHHHVRDSGDAARVARLVTGRGIGLVLSGGGARGFAHVGVIRALRECGLSIDAVGGTSIGSVIAAMVAKGWDHEVSVGVLRRCFVDVNPVGDYTLPLVSLAAGRRVGALLRGEFGTGDIDDLPIPYYCVSANLTTGGAAVHREGPLWRWLRASVAIPGVLPPVCSERQVFVDGAAVDNLPVEVMREVAGGPVIAVDVSPEEGFSVERDSDAVPAPWDLWGWYRHGRTRPGIMQVLSRSALLNSAAATERQRRQADLLFRPALGRIDLLDWGELDRAIDRGYRYALQLLQRTALPWR